MKIAYLLTRLDGNTDPELYVRDYGLWLAQNGHGVAALSGFLGKTSDFLEHHDIECLEIPDFLPSAGLFANIKALWQIFQDLRRLRPDLVSCHEHKAGLLGGLAARLAGIPCVYVPHFPGGGGGLARVSHFIARCFCSALIADTEILFKRASRPWVGGEARLIRTGLPNRPVTVRPATLRRPQLLMVGDIDGRKDHARLIRALWGCLDLDWDLLFVGNGDDLELRSLVNQLELGDRVTFLGDRDDVAEMLDARIDIVCLLSRHEGLPSSILQAMRAGLPVIASDVGGLGEAVRPGETGWLVAADDDAELITVLRDLIVSADRRRDMGAAGRRRYEELFSFQDMAGKTLAFYQILAPGAVDKSGD